MSSTNASPSATMIAAHMPLSSNAIGKSNTAPIWNISVRANDTIAEIRPLLRAVKNDEVKMLNPINMNEMEYMRIAVAVISSKSLS